MERSSVAERAPEVEPRRANCRRVHVGTPSSSRLPQILPDRPQRVVQPTQNVEFSYKFKYV